MPDHTRKTSPVFIGRVFVLVSQQESNCHAAGIVLLFIGGGGAGYTTSHVKSKPFHADIPAPRTFPHTHVPISPQSLPAGITAAIGQKQAIQDALNQMRQQDPHISFQVTSAVLVSKKTSEADIGSVSPWFPDYFWKIGLTSSTHPLPSTATPTPIVVFVDSQTGHPWIIWTPSAKTPSQIHEKCSQ